MKRDKPVLSLSLFLALVLALALSGCASAPTSTAAVAAGGEIAVTASSFRFDPNVISVRGTGTITLAITNASGASHNFVVKDEKGNVIDSVDLPPHGTVTTEVTFPAAGEYPFVCTHPFHADFGMKGRFIVSGT